MIHRGRSIKVLGEPYTWRLSQAEGRFQGSSGKTATFTAQHSSSHGALLRVHLVSRYWTARHDWDDDLQQCHKCTFTPGDASALIELALDAGWEPKQKGKEHHGAPRAVLTDYVTAVATRATA
jgi:hypothetical protein